MSTCSKWHRELVNGKGLCSVPMWINGCPAGFCDEPAYGKPTKASHYKGYVPGLACRGHGGPKLQEVLNLCTYCKLEFGSCKSDPKFGSGRGNDNVYECAAFLKRTELEDD